MMDYCRRLSRFNVRDFACRYAGAFVARDVASNSNSNYNNGNVVKELGLFYEQVAKRFRLVSRPVPNL